jgi:hypothetical protein
MSLKENYERFFGNLSEQKNNNINVDGDVKSKFANIASAMAKKYPNAPLTLKEGYVWMGNKKVEPAKTFINRNSLSIHEMVRSFSNSQSKKLI